MENQPKDIESLGGPAVAKILFEQGLSSQEVVAHLNSLGFRSRSSEKGRSILVSPDMDLDGIDPIEVEVPEQLINPLLSFIGFRSEPE
jgi:hypothetical protein